MASFSHSMVLHYFLMVHKDVFVNKNLNKKMTKVNIKIPNSCMIKDLDKSKLREECFILPHRSRSLSIMVKEFKSARV